MTQATSIPQDQQHTTQAMVKRAYLKPAFHHETVFETMALSCGKVANTMRTCHDNRKTS